MISLDLANHIIASEGWRVPRDFGDSFTILGAHGVIDDTRVHELLAAGLPDLDTFATALAKLVS